MEHTLLRICKSKIDNGLTDNKLMEFIENNGHESIFLKIKEELEEYRDKKITIEEKNKSYWMLICNPKEWYEETEEHQVNKLLKNLDENTIEPWKINSRTDMELQMKVGQRGIIKVSDDKRTKANRYDDKGELVDKLDAGIYGIFEIVEDEEEDCTYESESGDFYVNIKVIDNFYAKNKIILKEKARELLGLNVYNSIPSTKIDKKLFDNIVNYQAK